MSYEIASLRCLLQQALDASSKELNGIARYLLELVVCGGEAGGGGICLHRVFVRVCIFCELGSWGQVAVKSLPNCGKILREIFARVLVLPSLPRSLSYTIARFPVACAQYPTNTPKLWPTPSVGLLAHPLILM
jgi:hypothetical protein